jgi:hypothetical protein
MRKREKKSCPLYALIVIGVVINKSVRQGRATPPALSRGGETKNKKKACPGAATKQNTHFFSRLLVASVLIYLPRCLPAFLHHETINKSCCNSFPCNGPTKTEPIASSLKALAT